MKNILLTCVKVILIGLFVGLFVTFFQYISHLVIELGNIVLCGNIAVFFVSIAISIVVFIIIYLINRRLPGYYGSGIPQIEGYHHGWNRFSPYKMLVLIMLNSFYAFYAGFLLGGEGPSVSISSSVGMIINKWFKKEDKSNVAVAGSAGFACAFLSPLAGLCHLIEENKKTLNYKMIIKGIFVILISFTIIYLIYPHSLLPYFDIKALELKYCWLFIPLIILSVLCGKLFIILIVKTKDITKGKKIMLYVSMILAILFMCLKRFYPIMVGSGSNLLSIDIIDLGILIILGILTFRLFFIALSASSNISGGLVLPMLSIGALIGIIIVKAYSFIDCRIIEYAPIFIIAGMLIVFAVVTNAPLTAFVLGLKCAPIGVIAIPLIICIIISMIPFYLFKWKNIYHELEKRISGYIDVHDKTI